MSLNLPHYLQKFLHYRQLLSLQVFTFKHNNYILHTLNLKHNLLQGATLLPAKLDHFKRHPSHVSAFPYHTTCLWKTPHSHYLPLWFSLPPTRARKLSFHLPFRLLSFMPGGDKKDMASIFKTKKPSIKSYLHPLLAPLFDRYFLGTTTLKGSFQCCALPSMIVVFRAFHATRRSFT